MVIRRIGTRAMLVTVGVLAALLLTAMSSVAAVPTITCTGPIGPGTITANVVAGPGCVLEGETTIEGNVTVQSGGSLEAFGELSLHQITGNLIGDEASAIELAETHVAGRVHIDRTHGSVLLRFGAIAGPAVIEYGSGSVEVDRVWICGNLRIHHNASNEDLGRRLPQGEVVVFGVRAGGSVEVAHNSLTGTEADRLEVVGARVGGNLRVLSNRLEAEPPPPPSVRHVRLITSGNEVAGSMNVLRNTLIDGEYTEFAVEGNTVTNTLLCRHDSPAPMGGDNTAASKRGQCEGL